MLRALAGARVTGSKAHIAEAIHIASSNISMTTCKHSTLELLPERKTTLRCRRCHLTISEDELGDGFCPECFDATGAKNYDFETVTNAAANVARYRCENCGAIITSG